MAYLNLEDNLLQQKRWREKALEMGQCTRCKKPAVEGFKLCEYHIEYAKQANRKQPKEKKNVTAKANSLSLKNEVFEHYGGACKCCGITEHSFLTIDHINGDGAEHRKKDGRKIFVYLKKNGFPEEFRILCYNCNIAIGRFGVCPHGNLAPQITNSKSNPYKISLSNNE